MTVRVGVIGVGMIGQDHIRRITSVLVGSRVVAGTMSTPLGRRRWPTAFADARVHTTGQELIRDEEVDAVVVTSWARPIRSTSRPVSRPASTFCEKPLATTQEACLRIIDAEVAFRRRLVQVGFIRRPQDALGLTIVPAAASTVKPASALPRS